MSKIKVLRCQDCGGMPALGLLKGGDPTTAHCDCGGEISAENKMIDIRIWNAIQRRKRMDKKWELLCAASSCVDGSSVGDDFLEGRVSEFFGPAEGEEVGDD